MTRALTYHKVTPPKKNHNPWLFSCSVIENEHAYPLVCCRTSARGQWWVSPTVKSKTCVMVALWFWCVLEQLRPPKDIQGCSWSEKGRGALHYPFQWLNLEQNWNVYVPSFVSFFHSQDFSGLKPCSVSDTTPLETVYPVLLCLLLWQKYSKGNRIYYLQSWRFE